MNTKSPLKAIRANCLDCMGGSANEVKNCPSTQCPLFPFRFGHSPNRTKRIMTEEQKNALRIRFAEARKRK